MIEEIKTIETIKTLYAQIKNKSAFIIDLAEALELKPSYLRQHWFQMFWSIPEKYQDRTKEMLEAKINEQKATA